MSKTYRVNIGIDFPPEQRREAGDTVTADELPKSSIEWLTADGHLTEIKSPKPTKQKPAQSDE